MDIRRLRLRRALSRFSCRRGGAAVEFALVAPMLMALMAGITVFGIALGAAHNLRQITAEAARASIAGVTDSERAALAQSTVDRSVGTSAMFRPGSLAVQVGPDPSDSTIYVVTVSLDVTTLGLNAFSRLLPLIPGVMRSTVSVRKGGL